MKAVILLGTLKPHNKSNTESLCVFFAEYLAKHKIECEIIKLVNYHVMPGTQSKMDDADAWPHILEKILDAEMLILATPIWWGSHSSEIQRVIERLDEIHDDILAGEKSKLDGKVGGIIVSGDSDGAEHIIGNIANFYNAVGIVLPPYATLTILWDGFKKDSKKSEKERLAKLKKDDSETADKMVKQMLKFAKMK